MSPARDTTRAILNSMGCRYRENAWVKGNRVAFLIPGERIVITIGTEAQGADRWMVRAGYRVLRFSDALIEKFPRRVKATICAANEPRNTRNVLPRVLPSTSRQDETTYRVMSRLVRQLSQ